MMTRKPQPKPTKLDILGLILKIFKIKRNF